MKLLILALFLAPSLLLAQTSSYQTVFNTSDFESFWTGGSFLNYHRIGDSDLVSLGVKGGWLFNKKWNIGLWANHSVSSSYSGGVDPKSYGFGTWFGKVNNPDKAIHTQANLYMGWFTVEEDNWRGDEVSGTYFTLNPTYGIQANISDRLRVEGDVGYRGGILWHGSHKRRWAHQPTINIGVVIGVFN
jgi:hypothetical protein